MNGRKDTLEFAGALEAGRIDAAALSFNRAARSQLLSGAPGPFG